MAAPGDDQQQPEALSALQEAALHLLGAAKLFIVAAEEAVKDPKALGRIGDAVTGTIADIARVAARMVAPQAPEPAGGNEAVERIELNE